METHVYQHISNMSNYIWCLGQSGSNQQKNGWQKYIWWAPVVYNNCFATTTDNTEQNLIS